MNRFVSLNSVTAEAKSLIKTATDKDRLLFKQWVYRGLREIGPGKQNVDVCTIYPHNNSLKKPDDMHSAIDIALFGANGNEIRYRYNSGKKRIHLERRRVSSDGVYTNGALNILDLSEDDYYFHVSSNSETMGLSYAKIRYFKFPVDEDGLPKIPEDQVHALTMFIRYMWSMREDSSASGVRDKRDVWMAERDRAKSRNKMPSMLEGKQIAKEWMSMIDKPFFNRF